MVFILCVAKYNHVSNLTERFQVTTKPPFRLAMCSNILAKEVCQGGRKVQTLVAPERAYQVFLQLHEKVILNYVNSKNVVCFNTFGITRVGLHLKPRNCFLFVFVFPHKGG